MPRDKAKEDRLFNCGQEWEFEQVASHYPNKDKIIDFLKEQCENNNIKNSTHCDVYHLIKDKLDYDIPSTVNCD